MRWLLNQLLVLLQDLLQLLVLLHEGLVLDACPLLLHLLPLGRRSLELLQAGRFFGVLRSDLWLLEHTGAEADSMSLFKWNRFLCETFTPALPLWTLQTENEQTTQTGLLET